MDFTDNVRQTILDLVPTSIANEIVCFVFYDNHPAQSKICDIAIYTTHGEVKEYYKREEVSSLYLGTDIQFSLMRILRNSRSQLFYLLSSENELVILSRKENLNIHKKVTNIEYYDINDSACRGQAYLKIVLKDDAVPLIFDDNLENLGDNAVALNGMHVDDSLPILTQLKRKLTQAVYSIQCNEKTRREFMELRKLSTFAAYRKLHPNLDDSMFNEGYSEANEMLKLKTQSPSVAICNQKVVITMNVINKNKITLHDIMFFLHTNKPSIVYTTQLYERTINYPFWAEVLELQPDKEAVIAAIVDLTELQYNRTSRVEFNGVISYKKRDKYLLMPFNPVVISYSEFVGKQFDVLANDINDVSILSILATTKKLDLTLRIIANEATGMTLSNMFCQYLEMELVTGMSNAVVHKKSPHHILNGIMVIFENENAVNTSVAVHVRSDSQVLPLIHYIHEAIPHRIIVTSRSQKITATVDSLSMYNEEIPKCVSLKLDYMAYAPSILYQLALILEYLDSCIVKMNSSKDAEVKSKIGKEIDLFAEGLGLFMNFRSNLLNEALKGVQCLKQSEVKPVADSGSMFLDNE